MALALRTSSSLLRIGSHQARTFIPTSEHIALKENLMKLIEKEINPHCEKWEQDKIFPAHEVFKILGKIVNLMSG